MEEENINHTPELTPEEIIKQNFPSRLTRLQKEYKRLNVLDELADWSNWMVNWSREIKKELNTEPEALYRFFKSRLKKSKPKLFRS